MKKGKWGIIALSIAMLIVGIFIGNMFSDSFIIGDKNSLKGNIGELATGPSTPDRCIPKTCSQLGKTCGTWGDGCNANLDCGTCESEQTCSNGNCVVSSSVPFSASSEAIADVPSLVQSCAVAAAIINGEIPVDDATWEEFRSSPYAANLISLNSPVKEIQTENFGLTMCGPNGCMPPPRKPLPPEPIPPNPNPPSPQPPHELCLNKCGDGKCQITQECNLGACTCLEDANKCPYDCKTTPPSPGPICNNKCGDGVCQALNCFVPGPECDCGETPNNCPRDCKTTPPPTPPPNSCNNKCGDGVCQATVCTGVGCTCTETKNNCPRDCAPSTPLPPNPVPCTNQCGNGVCQQFYCLGTDCPCAETSTNCPGDCPRSTPVCPAICLPFPNCDPPGPCNYCCGITQPPKNSTCKFGKMGTYCFPTFPFKTCMETQTCLVG